MGDEYYGSYGHYSSYNSYLDHQQDLTRQHYADIDAAAASHSASSGGYTYQYTATSSLSSTGAGGGTSSSPGGASRKLYYLELECPSCGESAREARSKPPRGDELFVCPKCKRQVRADGQTSSKSGGGGWYYVHIDCPNCAHPEWAEASRDDDVFRCPQCGQLMRADGQAHGSLQGRSDGQAHGGLQARGYGQETANRKGGGKGAGVVLGLALAAGAVAASSYLKKQKKKQREREEEASATFERGETSATSASDTKRYDIIPPGTVVTLKGLVKAPERNGSRGAVKEHVEDSGRYIVVLESTEETMSVRQTNLLQHAGVQVHDIKSQKELNGKVGTIVGWTDSRDRYEVDVPALRKRVSLKPSNVVLENGTIAQVTGFSDRCNGRWGTVKEWIREESMYRVRLSPQLTIRAKIENVRV